MIKKLMVYWRAKQLISDTRSSLLKQGFKDHEIAKTMGYELCDCTQPPQIMLFVWQKKENVCPLCKKANAVRPRVTNKEVLIPWKKINHWGSSKETIAKGEKGD